METGIETAWWKMRVGVNMSGRDEGDVDNKEASNLPRMLVRERSSSKTWIKMVGWLFAAVEKI